MNSAHMSGRALLLLTISLAACGGGGSGGRSSFRSFNGLFAITPLATGDGPSDLEGTDLDGDGRPELILCNESAATLSLRLNTTSGSASTPSFASALTSGTATGPVALACADLDGDGRPDIVLVERDANQLSIFRNTSSLGSLSIAAPISLALPSSPREIAFGDFNNDNRLDLATVSAGSSQFSIHLNLTVTPGTLLFSARQDFSTGTSPRSLAIGDLNGDGRVDIAVANGSESFCSVYLNTTAQNAPSVAFPTREDLTTGSSPTEILISDFNADGAPELAVVVPGSARVLMFVNQTPFNASIPNLPFVDVYPVASGPTRLVISDYDRNGRPDFIILQGGARLATLYLNAIVSGPQSGFADFTDFVLGPDLGTGNAPLGPSSADLDGDARPDLSFVNQGDDTLSIYLSR